MEKLKDIKIKHNHTLTDILKVLIFALVMLAPFGAVLSKCLYTTFNKNAKDSYSGNYEITYKYQSNQVNSVDDLIVGNIYTILLDDNTSAIFPLNGDSLVFIPITTFELNNIYYSTEESLQVHTFKDLVIEIYHNDDYVYLNVYTSKESFLNNEDYCVSYILNNTDLISDNGFIGQFLDCNNISSSIFSYTDYNEIESVNLTGTLDNSFYYAVNELSEQPLFSWTKNTFIYSTINQMTTGLDFGNNNVLALLLTYWILNTMIYIIFDIIIEVFKKLTHAFN